MKYINYALIMAVLLGAVSAPVDAKMSKEAHSLYQQACGFEYKRNYSQAIEIMKQAIEINGDDAMLYTKIAGLYAEQGNYTAALEAYNKALKLQPNDAFIYISVGGLYQNMQNYKAAFEAYSKATEIFPSYKYNYLNMANVKYISKDYKSAIEYYDLFLGAYPEHSEANENLANSYLAIGENQRACDIYSRLYENSPDSFKDYFKYGVALFNSKKYDTAVFMLKKAVNIDETNTIAWADLAISYQNLNRNEEALDAFKKTFELNPNLTAMKFDYANLLGNIGQYEDAIVAYKEYIEAFPQDANAYKNLGIVYKDAGKDDLALLNLEKAYLKNPSCVETQKILARYYHEAKDYAKAMKYYDLVLQTMPNDFDVKANKALVLHAQQNYPAAIDMYKDLLQIRENSRINKNLISAQIAYGFYLLERMDYAQSTLYFKDALRTSPDEGSAYFGLAEAAKGMGLKDLAVENYILALEKEPDNTKYYDAYMAYKSTFPAPVEEEIAEEADKEVEVLPKQAPVEEAKSAVLTYDDMVQKGNELYKLGRYNEAVDYFTKATIMKPDDYLTMLKVGNIYNLIGDEEKAMLFYEHSVEVNSEYADGWFNLGLMYAKVKRPNDSIKCFEKVIKLTPDYPYSYYALGMAYETIGDKFNAVENYTLYKGFETDEKMLQTIDAKIEQLEK